MNIGIAFITGRKSFKKTLNTYINNWLEGGLLAHSKYRFHLYIVYDTTYQNASSTDFKNIPEELLNSIASVNYYGEPEIEKEIADLDKAGILAAHKGELVFGHGYGRKRNVAMYFAIKQKMDKIIFIDDDEYPIATYVDKTGRLIWTGQSVVGTHLEYNEIADITHGHHCGYISPIPYLEFNENLSEPVFQSFIEAISNDIISWEKISNLIFQFKGVTYADPQTIEKQVSFEVPEEAGMKFISGANLCINFRNYKKIPPFYNPPGARGEDTFMSTALSHLKVLKVPCYTFHDGFGKYKHLLNGVLPLKLSGITQSDPGVVDRFLKAAIGWVRYKPLLTLVTNEERFEHIMDEVEYKLEVSTRKLVKYFDNMEFNKVLTEFRKYRRLAPGHNREFQKTKLAWEDLMKQI